MQVSLKSVRVFYVTQLKFRTVEIQGFLITPCMNTSTITTKSKNVGRRKSQLSNTSGRWKAGQLEVSTSLLCHSTQIQNCGNSRFPHHTLHEYKYNHNKEQEPRNSQLSNTSRRWNAGQLEVSTSLLCHSTQIQNCGNSRFPHHTLHEYKYNHNKEQERRT